MHRSILYSTDQFSSGILVSRNGLKFLFEGNHIVRAATQL